MAMTLDDQWRETKVKRDSAAATHGRNSRVTRAYERDLHKITERRLRRDMRNGRKNNGR